MPNKATPTVKSTWNYSIKQCLYMILLITLYKPWLFRSVKELEQNVGDYLNKSYQAMLLCGTVCVVQLLITL